MLDRAFENGTADRWRLFSSLMQRSAEESSTLALGVSSPVSRTGMASLHPLPLFVQLDGEDDNRHHDSGGRVIGVGSRPRGADGMWAENSDNDIATPHATR